MYIDESSKSSAKADGRSRTCWCSQISSVHRFFAPKTNNSDQSKRNHEAPQMDVDGLPQIHSLSFLQRRKSHYFFQLD